MVRVCTILRARLPPAGGTGFLRLRWVAARSAKVALVARDADRREGHKSPSLLRQARADEGLPQRLC